MTRTQAILVGAALLVAGCILYPAERVAKCLMNRWLAAPAPRRRPRLSDLYRAEGADPQTWHDDERRAA